MTQRNKRCPTTSSSSPEIARKTNAKNIVLCGDIFSNRQVFHKVYKELSKKYNLILPTEYAMDYI